MQAFTHTAATAAEEFEDAKMSAQQYGADSESICLNLEAR